MVTIAKKDKWEIFKKKQTDGIVSTIIQRKSKKKWEIIDTPVADYYDMFIHILVSVEKVFSLDIDILLYNLIVFTAKQRN